MLVHHMAKLSEVQRRPGQRLRGSSALHGWVDSALYLERPDEASPTVNVVAEHRAAPAPESFSFELRCQECSSGPAMWLAASDSKETVRQGKVERAVIDAIQDASYPLGKDVIRKKVGGRMAHIEAAIKALSQRGVLELVDFERELADGRKRIEQGWRILK